MAIRIDGFASYNFGNEGSADFGAPFVMKILSDEKYPYKFLIISISNERGSVAGLEDAFLDVP